MPKTSCTEGIVRAVGRGGEAVIETEGGIVLAGGALPGERVEIEGVTRTRRVGRGRIRRVARPSPSRVEPACAIAGRCGGCPLMIAKAGLQKEIKLGFLREACRELPGFEGTSIDWVPSPHALGYRRRARLGWDGPTFGYRGLRSKRMTDVEECLVLLPTLQHAWEAIRSAARDHVRGSGEILLQLTRQDEVVVVLSSDEPQPEALYDACAELVEVPVVAGVLLSVGGTLAPATWGEVDITVLSEDGSLLAPALAFTQANDEVNDRLVREVVALAEPRDARVLELHCGIGNFTVALASQAPRSLVAVELDPRAVQACQRNLAHRGLRARVVVGDANRPPKGRVDALVLDPPRRGARALFEDADRLRGARRIVYVSCDTATLGRDLQLAAAHGYRVDRMVAFDMFPQTAHLESVVRLVRS